MRRYGNLSFSSLHMFTVTPAEEAVRKFKIARISAVRPSRQLLRSFIRMRDFINFIKGFPHAEERLRGASRSTHHIDAANFLTGSEAGVHLSAPKTVVKVVRCFACPGKTAAWVPAFAGTIMEVSF
jgi:hypothetical protein